ncbi:threonine-phosphate decarboxylase CobD [Larkinella harenae]
MLHGHGDDRDRYQQPIRADFSTNVWYGGEPKGLKEHLFNQWERINRYPEVVADSLAWQIAEHHRVAPEQVLISSGTTESIYLTAQAYAHRRTTLVIPAFAEYEDAGRMHHHTIQFLHWQDLPSLPRLTSDLVFICNPNNPTGSGFHQLADWMRQNPQTLFVVDEAFIEFTAQLDTIIPLLSYFENLLVMRSLTKAYAIPGLRLGYVVGTPSLIEQLKQCKQPWTVNAMALAAGQFIFDQYDRVQVPLVRLLADKETFVDQLRRHSAVEVYESSTHFFLARTRKGNAAQLKTFLVEKHGLLIRDASNFRGLDAGHFRVCTLSPDKNPLLVNALAEWSS